MRPGATPTGSEEEAASIEELWAWFGGPLRGFIAKRVRDKHDTEDVLQEVFLKAHSAVHRCCALTRPFCVLRVRSPS